MRITQSVLAIGLIAGLGIALLQGINTECLADALHFYSGKMMRGKLSRVTGDLIEFTEGNGFGSKKVIHRLHLSNRHDCVETRNKLSYFGEIIYVDKFKIDMQTTTGMVKINRLTVTNVIMGTPMDQVAPSSLNRIPVNPLTPGSMNESLTPNNSSMPPFSPSSSFQNNELDSDMMADSPPMTNHSESNEDEDAIPAVDNMP
jgi:hypothetical protein